MRRTRLARSNREPDPQFQTSPGALLCAIALAIALLAPSTAFATTLPSTITENMTLTPAGNPYTGSPTIESGVTVKVEPGVKLTLGSLTVKGTLKAEGTTAQPVLFTSGVAEPQPGDWSYIKFEPGSGGSILDHTEVAYGGSSETGSIEINASSPTIVNSTIRKSKFVAISIPHGGSPEIAHNTFVENGMVYYGRAAISYYATPAEPGDVNIHNNTVEKGGNGISVSNASTTGIGKSLGSNTVTGTWGTGLSYSGTDVPPDIAENTLSGNEGSNYINVSGSVAHSATWKKGGSVIKGSGELTVVSGATLQINPGVVFLPNRVIVKGTLKAEGTAAEPVIFTSGAKEPKPGEWKQIKFEPGSGESVLDYTEIAYGAGGEIGAVEINGASPRITHTTFRKNQAHAIRAPAGGSPTIAYDTFIENGFYYLGRETITYTATATASGSIDVHDNTIKNGGGGGINISNSSSGKVDVNNNTVEASAGSGITVSQNPTTGGGGTMGGNVLIGNEGVGLSYSGIDIPGNITENVLNGNSTNRISISGTVAHSSTWGKGNAPISLGEVTVAPGVTLTIAPGVTLFPTSTVTVKGTLKADGTIEEPIAFTSGASEPKPGTWNYMKFEPGSDESILDHVEIAYGGSSEVGAIEVNASSPTITYTTFHKNESSALRVPHGGSPEIAHNYFSGNGFYYLGRTTLSYTATTAEPGEVNIYDNIVEGGGGAGITIYNGSTVGAGGNLSGNRLIENKGIGLSFSGADIPGNITENTLVGNENNVISVSGTVAHSSTWNEGGSRVDLGGEVTVASGITLKMTAGLFLTKPNMVVKGTLKAEGTSAKPVFFTGPKEEAAGEWKRLIFEPGSGESVLDHAEVAYGGSPTSSGMIEARGSHPTITNSTIRKAKYYGIKVTDSGAPKMEWNRFRGNANGLHYEGTGNLSAPNNDWGCASGPKPAGCGDSVTSNVGWKPAVQLPELGGHCRGKDSQCGEGADPVSLATGYLSYSHRDLLLTNKSDTPLEFVRAYNSGSSADTGLGPGWSQTGLASATELTSGEVLIVRQDGRQDLFQKAESGYTAPSGVSDTLVKNGDGTFTLTTLDRAVYAFDSSGRIASISDDHGLKTSYGYNASGLLTTITDPSAQTLTFTYNASNHITAVKDSTGREVKYAYSAAGDLATVTDALGGVTEYVYDSAHRITSIKDPRGNVILKNTYGSQGRITEQRDGLENLWKLEYKEGETIVTEPEGGKLAYGFDAQSRVVSETDQLGNKAATAYDAAGNVKEVVKPGGAKWTFGYDTAGNLTSVTDPLEGKRSYAYDAQNRLTGFTDVRGNAWSYEWSAANDLTKVTDPEGKETTLAYDAAGLPSSVTDANSHKTEFTYDARGNRLSETDPLGHKTSYEYNARNQLISQTAPGLKAESFERNALGDLLARTTPLGSKTKYAYDANGMPTQITDPGENVWKITYNAMERPTAYTDPAEQQTAIGYNGNLKPAKVTDRRGKETIYAYDLVNRLSKITKPEGGVWSFGYDARGNRTSMVDPRENTTTYVYDLLDRMTEAKEPLAVTTKYAYDANGNLTQLTDPRGNATSYSYDKLGRLTQIAQPLGKTTSLAYDAVGNPLTRTTAGGTLIYGYDADSRLQAIGTSETTLRSFGYDAADRLTTATDVQGKPIEIGYDEDGRVASIDDGRGQALTRAYNARNLLTKQVDARGALEYAYDKLGRLTSLTDPQGKASSFAYDAEGDLTEVKRPGGITTTNIYDNAGRLSETTSKAGEPATVLEALKYGYDPAGNVVKRIDTRLEAETTFAYDALGRLTEFNPPGEGTTTYAYDAAGNRTQAGSLTYTFNALNQLTGASDGATYAYDGVGRMATKAKGSEKASYEWDLLDQLTKVRGPATTTRYAYDALGRLSERKAAGGPQVVHYGDLTDLATYDATEQSTPTFSSSFGSKGTGNGQFDHPSGIARDAAGNLWVADQHNKRVEKFNAKGEYLSGFATPSEPSEIEIDSSGNVWVGSNSGQVTKLNQQGEILKSIGSWGEGEGQFRGPEGLASTPGGHIWVADKWNHRLKELNQEGGLMRIVGSEGTGPGQFREPAGIDIHSDYGNRLWIADLQNNRVQQLSESGEFLLMIGGEVNKTTGADICTKANVEAGHTCGAGIAGPGNGQFDLPDAVAVDTEGHVWIADQNSNRVQEFTAAGEYVAKLGSEGSGAGQFEFTLPMGMTIDAAGSLWVSDQGGNRVQRWQIPQRVAYQGSFGSKGTGNGQFDHPSGVALDAAGNIWVADQHNKRIEKFNAKGEYLSGFSTPYQPSEIEVDPSGNIWVGTNYAHVFKFNQSGELLKTVGGTYGEGENQFRIPEGIAAQPNGTIWVTDKWNHRLKQLNSEGEVLRMVGSEGTGPGQFSRPTGIDLRSDYGSTLWVADFGNDRVQKLSESGQFLLMIGGEVNKTTGADICTKANVEAGHTCGAGVAGRGEGEFYFPDAIAIDAEGHVWVADQVYNRVQEFTGDGDYIGKFGNKGWRQGQFDFTFPMGMVVDASGDLWISDQGNNRVQRWQIPQRVTYQGSFGSKGTGNGQFDHPSGVAFDAAGNIWVADQHNKRIEKFNAKGEYLSQFSTPYQPSKTAIDPSGNIWVGTNYAHVFKFNQSGELLKTVGGTYGEGENQFRIPEGVAAAPNGNVWVTDKWNHRLKQLNSEGEVLRIVGSEGSGPSQFSRPTGIEVESDGNRIWVADFGNDRVLKLNAAGEFVLMIGGEVNKTTGADICTKANVEAGHTCGAGVAGRGEGEFYFPDAIAIDAEGHVWVADQVYNRVQEFTEDGDYIGKFGNKGWRQGQFDFTFPMGMAIDGAGDLWISDQGNNRVQRWTVSQAATSYLPATTYVQGPDGLLEQRSSKTTYPLADAHGDITAIITEAGGVASRQTYDPWGNQLSGPSLEMGYLGAQQRRADPLSGLIQMGVRPYDAELGRFLSEDVVLGTIGMAQLSNRYAYAGNRTPNLTDLTGRYPFESVVNGAGEMIDSWAEDPLNFGDPRELVTSAQEYWVHSDSTIADVAGPAVSMVDLAVNPDRLSDYIKNHPWADKQILADCYSAGRTGRTVLGAAGGVAGFALGFASGLELGPVGATGVGSVSGAAGAAIGGAAGLALGCGIGSVRGLVR